MVSGAAGNNLTKSGAGTLTLSGANTYDGVTALNAGELIITGNQSAANGNITVAASTFLSGTGTAGGNITSLAGSMSPGSGQWSIGTFSVAGSSANLSGGTFVWDINDLSAAAGTGYDLLTFSSAYNLSTNLGGSALNVYIQDNNTYIAPSGGTAGTKYKIMENVTNFNASYFNLDSNLINTVWTITHNDFGGNALWLSYQVVPEPGTWITIIFMSFFLLFRIHKCFKSKNHLKS